MASRSKSSSHKNAENNDNSLNIPDMSAFFPNFLSSFTENLPHMPMNTSATWWQTYMTNVTEMNQEFMKFLTSRLQHDAEVSQSLAQCRDWQQATELHREWLTRMSEEYMAEAKTMMEISSSSAQENETGANGNEHKQADKPSVK